MNCIEIIRKLNKDRPERELETMRRKEQAPECEKYEKRKVYWEAHKDDRRE